MEQVVLAGLERLELPRAILEIAMLPLHYTPVDIGPPSRN
jgi:hypothetical protein